MRIDSDDPGVTRRLERLADLHVRAGGRLHPAARIRVTQTRVMLDAPGAGRETADLVQVPVAGLPAIDRAAITLRGGRLERQAEDPTASSLQTDTLDAMLALYNALDRPRQWQAATPWCALSGDPEILEHLSRGRDLGRKPAVFDRLRAEKRDADLVAKSFLGSRSYQWGSHDRRRPVLMPFIDLLDHHWDAPPFDHRCDPEGLAVTVHRRGDDHPACYVRYGRLDALTSYLHYAFVDTHAPIVNSVPVSFCIDGALTFHIAGRPIRTRADAGRLGFDAAPHHLPRIQATAGSVTLDHFVAADARTPEVPLHLLERLMDRLFPDLPARDRRARAVNALDEIIDANVRYYERLTRMASDAPSGATGAPTGRDAALAACQRLAEHQLALLMPAKAQRGRDAQLADKAPGDGPQGSDADTGVGR